MKRLFGAGLALLLMGQAAPPARIADLGWMSGRWQTESADAERITQESWSEPRSGVMLGYSRTGGEDRLREFEFLRIQADADGVITYYAQPGGRAPVGFRLAARDAASATFENAQHDYPQRIRYERRGMDLIATISKLDGSNAMRWVYRPQR